jgi:hypothetical protein
MFRLPKITDDRSLMKVALFPRKGQFDGVLSGEI